MMQRPTKLLMQNDDSSLNEPLLLLPRNDDENEKKKPLQGGASSSSRVWILRRGVCIVMLTGELIWQFAKAQDTADTTVLFLPGEWVILTLTLSVVLQAQVFVVANSPRKAQTILDGYTILLFALRLVLVSSSLPWICNILALALICQSVFMGMELRVMIRSMERVRYKSAVDDDDDFDTTRTHWLVDCDGCNASPIIGIRYHSKQQQQDYDLCEACMAQQQQQQAGDNNNNTFVPITTPLPILEQDRLEEARKQEAYLRRQHYKAQQESAAQHEAQILDIV